jgi:tellurite resistance protein TerC
MLLNGDEDIYHLIRKIMPISNHIDGEHFFYQKKTYNRRNASFVALIIEVMDVIFAVDSVQPF